MIITQLATDAREHLRQYERNEPFFGAAPEALLQGFSELPDIEVHVVSCIQEQMTSPERLADHIYFHPLHVLKSGWLRTGYQGCIRAVRRKLQEIQPDIVHGQGTERDCAISAAFSGFPNVVTIHGNMSKLARLFEEKFGSFNWLAGKIENFTIPKTAGVFCNSEYTESLVSKRAKKTWRVPNAIRMEFFSPSLRPSSNESPVLLNIGEISLRKRQIELLDMAEELHSRGCRFFLRFIGKCMDSQYGAAFLRRIYDAEKQGFARYEGSQNTSELVDSMDSADALCHFPSEEAFGLVVAEGLARNLKFFGSRVGGIIDIAAGVEQAELVSSNDWEGLSRAIERWVCFGSPRPKNAATEMKRRYHPVTIAKRHLEIYREVLKQ